MAVRHASERKRARLCRRMALDADGRCAGAAPR